MLSISNIGWKADSDLTMYQTMKKYGFYGLEIAPTRIFPEKPYDHQEEASIWAGDLSEKYGLAISSMQSIWYGISKSIFGTEEDRMELVGYSRKAIDFAKAIGCRNLVFGCPRNRVIPSMDMYSVAVDFFKEIGDYAFSKGVCIGMEANPSIYNTNFINDTASAITLIKDVGSAGLLLNLDMGTVIHNAESLQEVADNPQLINHIHISEPHLKPIQQRAIHTELKEMLDIIGYNKYVSVEMSTVEDTAILEKTMEYVSGVFL